MRREGAGRAEAKVKSEGQSGVEAPQSKEVTKTELGLAFAILRGES
jgi:hypothetical protein